MPSQDNARCVRIMQRMDQLHKIRHILYHHIIGRLALHPGQLPILEFILQHPGCTQIAVAEALFVTPSSVAQSTKRMQKCGLLEKRICCDNQRTKQLHVTSRGEDVAARCRAGFDDIDSVVLARLTDQELEMLECVSERLLHLTVEYAAQDLEHANNPALRKRKPHVQKHSDDGRKEDL